MLFLSRLIAPSVVACVLASASIATASVELKFLEVNPGTGSGAIPLKFNGSSVTANVGQLVWDVRNDSGTPPISDSVDLVTFCIELSQYVSGSWNTYEKIAVKDAVDPTIAGKPAGYKIGAARAAALDKLADNFWVDATGTNLLNAVSFQLAVWEIVHEFGSVVVTDTLNPPLAPTLNISKNNGTFFVNSSPTSGLVFDAINLANNWLSQLATLTSDDNVSLFALTNATKQDQLVQYATPVVQGPPDDVLPEPLSLVVWVGLLGACGAVSRRSHR